MKNYQSLKDRKFNIIIPKNSRNIPNQEKIENKNHSKIIIKILGDIPYLFLPIKKIHHNVNKKTKNPKINPISLEKLKMIALKINRNGQNNFSRGKSQKNKKILNYSPNINYKKNKFRTHKNQTRINQSQKILNNFNEKDLNVNYNSKTHPKINDILISNINNFNININRCNSIENDVYTNHFDNEILHFRNKDKKWYNNTEFLTEKYNELVLNTENLEKNILDKYLDGTDNIISEMEEPQFLKEDIDINSINPNISIRNHVSIRETTTLDSSFRNSHNHKDKLKKNKGFILKIKNFRKMFKKNGTNINLKSKNNNLVRNKKKKKKLPNFNKSFSKLYYQVTYQEKKRNNKEYLYHRNVSYEKENNNSYFSLNETKSKYRNNLSYNEKNKLNLERRNQSLAIIKETNDNINIEYKNDTYRNQQSAKIISENNQSIKKIKIKGNSSTEKNLHSSEKYINNYKPKNILVKTKQNLNKNYKFFINDGSIFRDYNKSSIDEYIISSDLGIGSYAEVKLGIHKSTKRKYAIKIYDKNLLNDEDKKYTIKNEIFILRQLNSENIMKLYDVIETNNNLYLILEYINGISLLEYIQRKKNQRINENICKKFFYQIVKAVLYCQKKNIYHRDIKLENILIVNDNIIKLIDFGFAIKCNKNEYQEFFCGTLNYMPPEIVNKQKYIPFYSDIWSLGILLYTMLFGIFPFKSSNDEKLFELINEAKLIFPNNIEVSDKVKSLISKIIVIKPTKRLSLEEILNDSWFEK